MPDSIVISGFGRERVNGVYAYLGEKNGYPAYANSLGYIVMYVENRMPYTNDAGYVLLAPEHIEGAIVLETIPYLKLTDVTNVTTSGWTSTLSSLSGEVTVETPFYESSSDSSLSSVSSGSSSSSSSSQSSSSYSTSSSSSLDSSSSKSSSSSSSLSSVSSNSSSSSSDSSSSVGNSESSNSSSSSSNSSSSVGNSESSNSSSSSSKSLSSASSISSLSSNSSSNSSSSLSSASSKSLSSGSSQSTSSSSIDSSSSSSMDVIMRVSNSGDALLNGDYSYSGTTQNGWRIFDKDNQYYVKFNGSQWVLSDDWEGLSVARWNPSVNGYPDGLNAWYNPTAYPLAFGVFIEQINVSEFSLSSLSTQSSSSSS